jgi:hypothetical protein
MLKELILFNRIQLLNKSFKFLYLPLFKLSLSMNSQKMKDTAKECLRITLKPKVTVRHLNDLPFLMKYTPETVISTSNRSIFR